MNLLYIAALPIDLENLGGVPKKVFYQLKALSAAFDCKLLYYFDEKVRLYDFQTKKYAIVGKGSNRLAVIKNAKTICEQIKPDAVYIRYPKSEYYLLDLCRYLKSNHKKYVIEIPTYPYDMEGNEKLKGRLINIFDRIYRRKLKKYVSRIVTYSSDRTIFGIETIRTINGIDFDAVVPDYSDVDNKNEIIAIGVSAMYRVHGYDRFIEGLNQYYNANGKRNVILKLVGSGDKLQEYKELVDRYDLKNHVIFAGVLHGEELESIYRGCAVGVNSLAIHRQGLISESTLKTKEYAAKGLPVLSSSYVDAFSQEGNKKYAMIIPPDESPVNIERFIRFIDSIYDNTRVSLVRKTIRDDAKRTCDINKTMQPILEYLK